MNKTERRIAFFKREGVKFLDTMPEGWRINRLATNAPHGYVWINNGKPLLSGEYDNALLKTTRKQLQNMKR